MKAIENSCLAYWVVNGIQCMSRWSESLSKKGCKGVKQLKNNVIGLQGYWV